MKTGLLWFDNDPSRALEEKVRRAASRYQQKFGRRPNVCYVHPSLLDGNPHQTCPTSGVETMRVTPLPSVLRHHFWVGEEESAGPPSSGRHAAARQ